MKRKTEFKKLNWSDGMKCRRGPLLDYNDGRADFSGGGSSFSFMGFFLSSILAARLSEAWEAAMLLRFISLTLL